jgi:hypothetical protein
MTGPQRRNDSSIRMAVVVSPMVTSTEPSNRRCAAERWHHSASGDIWLQLFAVRLADRVVQRPPRPRRDLRGRPALPFSNAPGGQAWCAGQVLCCIIDLRWAGKGNTGDLDVRYRSFEYSR